MSRKEQGNVVFRVHFNPKQRDSQLVAYDLVGKAWYHNPFEPWDTQRALLRRLGIQESSLLLTDEAFASGTRDAQYAAVPLSLETLDDAGFTPKIW